MSDRRNLKLDATLHTQHKARKDELKMTWDEYQRWLLNATMGLDADDVLEAGTQAQATLEIDPEQLAEQVIEEMAAADKDLFAVSIDIDEDVLAEVEFDAVDVDALADYVSHRVTRDVLDGIRRLTA